VLRFSLRVRPLNPFGALRLLRAGSSLRLKNGSIQDDATSKDFGVEHWNPSNPCGVSLDEARGAFLLTSGADQSLRQAYGYQSPIAEMWRVSDLVECLIFISLALMLAYTVFVTARFFRRYFLARREALADFAFASQRSRKSLIAELSRGVETLKAIAFAAPFLGLAGTCYGMLCLFFRALFFSILFSIPALSLELSTALVATTAGLIAAIPAAVCYNVLRTRLEKFESNCSRTLVEATPRSYGFAQTLPLRRRFSGFPAFALMGAPVLAILIPMFASVDTRRAVGLPVHLLKIGVSDYGLPPIVVSVANTSSSGVSAIYVNSKETSWNELGNTLRNDLKVRPRWIVYVEGGDVVPWADLAYAIDVAKGLRAEVVLLTSPRIESGHQPKRKRRPDHTK
jgi:biopolymer transport protein ExbB/TolQ